MDSIRGDSVWSEAEKKSLRTLKKPIEALMYYPNVRGLTDCSFRLNPENCRFLKIGYFRVDNKGQKDEKNNN